MCGKADWLQARTSWKASAFQCVDQMHHGMMDDPHALSAHCNGFLTHGAMTSCIICSSQKAIIKQLSSLQLQLRSSVGQTAATFSLHSIPYLQLQSVHLFCCSLPAALC